MLQSFMRMRHIPVLRYIGFKEIFGLLYFPNSEPGSIVDLLLKKKLALPENSHLFCRITN